jgi:hypothetical protein
VHDLFSVGGSDADIHDLRLHFLACHIKILAVIVSKSVLANSLYDMLAQPEARLIGRAAIQPRYNVPRMARSPTPRFLAT